jgi:hypothetical protein
MEGRVIRQLNIDNRRARAELTNRVEGLAQQILDHIAVNPQPAARAGRGHPQPAARAGRGHPQPAARAGRGRAPSRPSTGPGPRSVSFSSVCGCPGLGCTSGPGANHPPAYSELNPAAPSFTPAHPRSRNKARRSRIQGGSSSTLCRPRLTYPDPRRSSNPPETVVLDTGLATPVLLIPPGHFATSGEARDSVRRVSSPPTRASTPRPAAPTPATPLPPRAPSPILEPDTSHIVEEVARAKKSIELGFRVNIADQFSHETGKIDKSYDYSCSCLNRKSHCTCTEAVLEVCLKVRYHLFDRLRHRPKIGGNES